MLIGSGADGVVLRCLCISPKGLWFIFEGFNILPIFYSLSDSVCSVLSATGNLFEFFLLEGNYHENKMPQRTCHPDFSLRTIWLVVKVSTDVSVPANPSRYGTRFSVGGLLLGWTLFMIKPVYPTKSMLLAKGPVFIWDWYPSLFHMCDLFSRAARFAWLWEKVESFAFKTESFSQTI